MAGNDYDTQMIADLAAGSAPDLYIIKNLKNFFTYQDGGQLMDVSDVASGFDGNTKGLSNYMVDGKTWAIPYRQDSWYLYYDKDMFDQAGVDYPDGSWTWDDYAAAADALSTALPGDDVYGAYMHRWQSCVQGFANAQSPGADILSGNFGYMKPFYDRVVPCRTRATRSTSTRRARTRSPTRASSAAEGRDAHHGQLVRCRLPHAGGHRRRDQFNWGIAPVPQMSSSTVSNPVTFGDPTAIGINPAIDPAKVDAAKEFLSFVASESGATALARSASRRPTSTTR